MDPKNLKEMQNTWSQIISRKFSTTDTNQLNNSGYGELPTPLIVANRSQQGVEVYGSYPLVLNRHPGKMSNTEHIQQYKAYTAASINIHAQSKAVKQAHICTSNLLCYNYYNRVPSNTDLTPAKPNTNTISGTVTQKPRIGSYKLNQICPTLLTQQKALNKAQGRIFDAYPTSYLNGRRNPTLMLTNYRREMSSHTSPASHKHPKAVPNEASQQEESSATTLTSIEAVYRQQSEKIRFGEQ
ncbi:hypothetical protein F511_23954 [Dorcoceras hygrometricum]|uniref:Uncharacterized protein n=1 Tax=Dorcoceras hygrometricum TaxID=472368 RepID=A0A2Z7CN19_9LAMI|nr:hypothetical protein F511_23954 [Dorcoceras hygrometricum]